MKAKNSPKQSNAEKAPAAVEELPPPEPESGEPARVEYLPHGFVVKLDTPTRIDGVLLSHLRFTRPTGKHLRQYLLHGAGAFFDIASQCSEDDLNHRELEIFDSEDLCAVFGALKRLMTV